MLLSNRPIGTVSYMGGIPALLEEFVCSLAQMLLFNTEALCGPGEYVHFVRTKASFHSYARNQLADQALGEWILMLDTDHQFEPDLCVRLVDRMHTYDADVVVGLYQHRQPPHVPVLYMKNDQKLYSPIGDWDVSAHALTVDSAGAGCLLIKTSVFQRIRDELQESPFDITYPLGEDHSFFKRCEQIGARVICDPRIEASHLTIKPITLADYQREAVQLAAPQMVQGYRAGVQG